MAKFAKVMWTGQYDIENNVALLLIAPPVDQFISKY